MEPRPGCAVSSNSYAATIKDCTLELQEENAKISKVLERLVKQHDFSEVLDQLQSMQIDSGAKQCTIEAMTLSVLSAERRQSNHTANLKFCTKIYTNLNSKVMKEIKSIDSQLQKSHEQVKALGMVPEDELKAMDARSRRYEAELNKFQSKYPWLANPQLDLIHIMGEANTLKKLRSEHDKLNMELQKYQGLKPNVREASEQLEEIKRKHAQLKDRL